MPNIGPLEIAIVLVIALLIFGPRKLPELGNSLGSSIRGFGKGLKGEDEEPDAEAGDRPAIPPRTEPSPPPANGPRSASRPGEELPR